jgi:hypothetical protein
MNKKKMKKPAVFFVIVFFTAHKERFSSFIGEPANYGSSMLSVVCVIQASPLRDEQIAIIRSQIHLGEGKGCPLREGKGCADW